MSNLILIRIQTFFKFSTLLKELVVRDIKVRYRKSVLGLLWTVLNPILTMLIIAMVFSNILRSNISNFPLYVLTGNIIFSFNSEATNQSLMSILSSAQLIKKVYIPKYLFPLSKVVSSLVNLGFSVVSLLAVMIITRQPFTPTMIIMIVVFVYIFFFSLGLGTLLSAINIFFRDIWHLYNVFLTLWMYLTPIFYSLDSLSPEVQQIIRLNPLFHYLNMFRNVVINGVFPTMGEHLVCISLSVSMMLIGFSVFKKTQDRFILYI